MLNSLDRLPAHADAEIIAMPIRILEKLNISHTKLRIGNTGVFREIFKQVALDTKDHGEIIWDLDYLVRLRNESQLWDLEVLQDALNILRRSQGSDYQGTYKIEASEVQELTENTASTYTEKLPAIAEETYKSRWQRYFNISEETAQRCIDVSKICGDKDTVMATWETHLSDTARAARQELLTLCDCLESYDITDFEINLGITRGFRFLYWHGFFRLNCLRNVYHFAVVGDTTDSSNPLGGHLHPVPGLRSNSTRLSRRLLTQEQ